MGKTISTHNGSAAHRGHNVREPWVTDGQEHIDGSLSGQNEILHDEKPRAAYERIFGDALRRYNEKQDRPERRIRDYYSHIEKDAKKHPVYEMIVQIGDRYDTGLDAPVERECLREFYEGWKERNPNLECIGAYIHADETDGTLHMHLDYVPVAHGYKKGLDTQTGLVKALKEQGFEKAGKETAQIQWQRRENQTLEKICLNHGIEVEHPESGRRAHMDTQLYKTHQKLQKAQESVLTLEGREKYLELHLEPLRAEYAAKKAYVASMSRDFNLIDGVKENKTLMGAVKSYTVPAEKWETQLVTRIDRDAQLHADQVFQNHIQKFKETASAQNITALEDKIGKLEGQIEGLQRENRELKVKLRLEEKSSEKLLERVQDVLDSLPEPEHEHFVQKWNQRILEERALTEPEL